MRFDVINSQYTFGFQGAMYVLDHGQRVDDMFQNSFTESNIEILRFGKRSSAIIAKLNEKHFFAIAKFPLDKIPHDGWNIG